MSALAGIDQALWDIKGKALGVPVHAAARRPVRDRIRVYSWIGGDRPADTAAMARDCGARGFSAVKMNATEEMQFVDTHEKVDAVLARVQAIREAMGPHFGIGVDFHGRVHRPMAKVIAKELEPYRPDVHRGAGAVRARRGAEGDRQPLLDADRARRAAVLALGLQAHPRRRLRRHHPARPVACGRHHRDAERSRRWPRRTTSRSRCIARSARSRSPPTCSSTPSATTRSSRSSRLGIHYNTANDLLDYVKDRVACSTTTMATSPSRRGPVWASRWTRSASSGWRATGHRWRNPVWRHADGSFAEW